MTRVIGPPRSRRRRRLFFAVLAAVAAAVIFIPSALAVHDLNFQLEGDPFHSTTTTIGGTTQNYDWDSFFSNGGTNGTISGPTGLTAGFTAGVGIKDFNTTTKGGKLVFDTNDQSTFTVASKDINNISGWTCTPANNVTDKGDIINAYAVTYTDPGDGQQYLYFGLERSANTGDANVGFWFLQGGASCPDTGGSFVGNHQDGDIFIVSAFTKGGTVSTITAYQWVGGAGGGLDPTPVAQGADCTSNSTPGGDPICATANKAAITSPAWPWLTYNKTYDLGTKVDTAEFFEGGLNLTHAGLNNECLNTFLANTRSSQQLTATLYDYALGTLGECHSTTVTTPSSTSDGNTAIDPNGISVGTGNSGVDVYDKAVVTAFGVPTLGGNVTWHLCGPTPLTDANYTLCTSGGALIGANPKSVGPGSPSTVVSDAAHLTKVGRYCFRADYSGDSATGLPASSDSSVSECFKVLPVTPAFSTNATGPVILGNAIDDTAHLTGTAYEPGTGGTGGGDPSINPTARNTKAQGSITFKLYGPSATAVCNANNLIGQSIVNVNGDNDYLASTGTITGTLTPTVAGKYYWVASYTGDSPNTNGASGACGDNNESSLVGNSSLTTTPKAADGTSAPPTSIGTGGSVQVKDSATLTVTGITTWSGTVKFFLCGPIASGTCDSGGTQIGAVAGIPVDQTTTNPILSDAATVTSAGRYCWRGVFTSATTGVPNASDHSTGECFTLAPVTPSLSTNATGPVQLGNPIDDTAHLTGTANEPGTPSVINPTTPGGPAQGSITFNLYGPSASPDCSAGKLIATRTVSVNGDGFYTASNGSGSGSLTPTLVGTYYWVASYSGDSPNTNGASGACGDANESSTVGSSSLTTTPKAGDGTSDPPTSIGTAGSVQVTDSANLTVSGVTTWSGTLKFFLCGPMASGTCDSGGTQIGAAAGIPVDQTTTNPIVSDAATVTSAGRYCWRGVFTSATTGVPNASDHSTGECFTLAPVTPSLSTNATGPVTLGDPIDDTAHLTGTANEPGTPNVINPTTPGGPAGGSITFKLYGPSASPDCSLGQLIATRTISVSGDGFYTASDGSGSGSLTPTLVGTYYWVASYTGDPPNTNGASGACGDANESSTVGSSSLTTTPKAGDGTSDPPTSIGTAGSVQVTDSAQLTVNGVTTWSGTLKFFLCGPIASGTCDSGGTQIGAAAGIPVDQTTTNPIVSDAATVTSAGRYCWRGEFTSATTGVPDASDHSAGECFTLAPVTPTLTTNASAPVEIGGALDDTAHLSGTANEPGTPVINPSTPGGPAGGTITFKLYGPSATAVCNANDLIGTSVVNVSGDDDYTASSGTITGTLTPSGTGTYYWVASYSGDSPNTNAAAGACGDDNESSKVVDALITISPDATNGITEPHTFTVHVEQDDGSGSGLQPVAGVNPTVTLTPAGGAVVSGVTDTCASTGTDASGNCTVTFTSNSAGTVTGHASVTLSIAGVSVTRATGDSNTGDSADAVKTFVQGSLKWIKHDGTGNLLGGATFQVCATAGTAASVGHTPLCVTVVDNTGQLGYSGADSDPVAGQFELDKYQSFGGTALGGLALGTYTITETVAPAGFQLDPFVDTEVIDQAHLNVTASHTFVDTQPGQGCTPGFWKNHTSAWNGPTVNPTDKTIIALEKVLTPNVTTTFAYSTAISNFNNQLFGQVFWLSGTNLRGLSSTLTLLGALNLGGGGFQALARHGTAGLLSSGSVDYPYSPLQVLQGVHDAFVHNNANYTGNSDFPDGVLTDLTAANNLDESACPS